MLVLGGALLAALGVGAPWILSHRVSSEQELIVRRLTSNSSDNPVTGALLSPDGKYLAFRDQTGMHLKLIETGDMQTIPQRVDSESARLVDGTQWFPAAWFPDSTRLLANVIQPGPKRSPSIWTPRWPCDCSPGVEGHLWSCLGRSFWGWPVLSFKVAHGG
jgi:hypothetical protein